MSAKPNHELIDLRSEFAWLSSLFVVALVFLSSRFFEVRFLSETFPDLPSSLVGFPAAFSPIRYLVYLAAVPVLFLLWYALVKKACWIRPPAESRLRSMTVFSQSLFFGLLIWMWIRQRHGFHSYFKNEVIVVGSSFLVVAGLRAYSRYSAPLNRFWVRLAILMKPQLPVVFAMLFTSLQLVQAVITDGSLHATHHFLERHLEWSHADFAGPLNGKTILVDFFPEYQFVTPYLAYPFFKMFGFSMTSFSILMALFSFFVLMMIYASLWAAAKSAWAALFLYVPVLLISFTHLQVEPYDTPLNLFTYYATGPLRYIGPMAMIPAFLLYLAKPTAVRECLLFFVGTFAVINNIDFSVPAYGAVVVSVFVINYRARSGWKLFLAILFRLVTVSIGTFICFGFLTYMFSNHWPEFYALLAQRADVAEDAVKPVPFFGLHWIVLATFLTCVVAALVRMFDFREPYERDGYYSHLLLFTGIFGSGIMSHYFLLGDKYKLICLFPVWAWAIALLFIPFAGILARPERPRSVEVLPAIMVTLGLGILLSNFSSVTSVAGEWRRLSDSQEGATLEFVDELKQEMNRYAVGEDKEVMSLVMYSDMAAYQAGVRNLSPIPSQYLLNYDFFVRKLGAKLDEKWVTTVITKRPMTERPVSERRKSLRVILEALLARGFNLKEQTKSLQIWQR